MRAFFLTFAGIFGLVILPAHDAHAALAGTACTQSGLSRMDTDGKNIIACVCKTISNCGASDLVWKTMAAQNISCPAGQAIRAIVNGTPQCSTLGVVNYTCPAGTSATSIVNGVPQCTPIGVINLSCPSGQYVLKVVNGVTSCATPPPQTCCGTFPYPACRGTGYMYRCFIDGKANF